MDLEEKETTSTKQLSDKDAQLSGVEDNPTRQQLEKEKEKDGNDVEPRDDIRLRSSQKEGEAEEEEDVGGEDDFTIPVFARHADLQDCVRSIEQWVRDCHKDQPIENDVFPTDVTIRGTSLLDDLEYVPPENRETSPKGRVYICLSEQDSRSFAFRFVRLCVCVCVYFSAGDWWGSH